IVRAMQKRAPQASIVLTAIFPRNDLADAQPAIDDINRRIASLADGRHIRFLDINDRLADAHGRLRAEISRDGLHPSVRGHGVWAAALKPRLTDRLGAPAEGVRAPPETGDPSAAGRVLR